MNELARVRLSVASAAALGAVAARPRSRVAERIAAFRRDVASVVRDLTGRAAPPSMRRVALARHLAEPTKRAADLLAHRTLVVERVVRETRDAVSLHLKEPNGGALVFTPGQFLTVLVTLPDGRAFKRAYSLSALPGEGEGACRGRITVKRIAGGKVSNHLVEHAREGDTLTVLGPSGHFGIDAEAARGKHLLLIGGGSGITPLRCILEARLSDPSVVATLLYGNRSLEDVIFRGELEELERAYPGRLVIRHVLESPPEGWGGGTGRLDRATAAVEITDILGSSLARGPMRGAEWVPPGANSGSADSGAPRVTEVLVCGPTPMMEAVRAVLADLGVPASQVREEQFSSPDQRRPAAPTRAEQVTFSVRGESRDTVASAGQTLLEAGLALGVKMPFSCAMGGCGACKVKLRSGEVVADEPNCLSADEASRGFVLACVSRAAGPVVVEVP